MKTFAIAATTTILLAAAPGEARPCSGAAGHLASGAALLVGTTPVQVVAARPGRCLLILSGWDIESDGSGTVNIGDASTTSDGLGGFTPPTRDAVELATEDELWAARRDTHADQVIFWIELYD